MFYVERGRLRPNSGNVPDTLIAEHAGRLPRVRPRHPGRRPTPTHTRGRGVVGRGLRELAADDPPGALGGAISRSAPQRCACRSSMRWPTARRSSAPTMSVPPSTPGTTPGPAPLLSSVRTPGRPTATDSSTRSERPAPTVWTSPSNTTCSRAAQAKPKRPASNSRDAGLAATIRVPTGGRSRSITYAIRPGARP